MGYSWIRVGKCTQILPDPEGTPCRQNFEAFRFCNPGPEELVSVGIRKRVVKKTKVFAFVVIAPPPSTLWAKPEIMATSISSISLFSFSAGAAGIGVVYISWRLGIT
jgi:hypothetical protein